MLAVVDIDRHFGSQSGAVRKSLPPDRRSSHEELAALALWVAELAADLVVVESALQ
ncbi:hypothetical protein ITP53_50270 [Nonomuraea sp. K274]|uniref:Uncharacterized protein n=1 Tax=Nonomuraea cypriaca TaxID=1187855 RepID=A0A931AMK8_9ACTN|nr:hypothetical protein [Nonomuraea cypriaca]MBF8193734.1 hypothetical protein [Nonomuraea cypriaca]